MNYWKIRALAAQVQLERERAERAIQQAIDRLHAEMREAGLDPAVPYTFDDTHEAITKRNATTE